MRRAIIYILICSLMLNACGTATEQEESGNAGVNQATSSAVTASDSALTASGAAAGAEKLEESEVPKKTDSVKSKKKIVKIITDETGKQRKLKTEPVNVENKGIYFSSSRWITNYSQVQDGHYYYMRGYNTIYRDKGEKVGKFWPDDDYFYDDCEPIGLVRYKKKFYVLLDWFHETDDGDWENENVLAYVDLKKKKAVPLWNMSEGPLVEGEGFVFCNFYNDFLYYNSRSHWDESFGRPGNLVKSPLKSQKEQETITTTANLAKAKPYLTYIDGKIYYGLQEGKKVTLYSHDLESGQEEKVFCYKRKDKKKTKIFLDMDEDYIYCQEYLIPRSGGKMIKAFADAKIFKGKSYYEYSPRSLSYSYNKKYIFYIDKNYKVHRIDKNTQENRVVSNLKAAEVNCTEDRVYVKVHAGAWYDKKFWKVLFEDDEGYIDGGYYYDHLYCMDLDGKNVKRIWEGSR